MLFLSPSSLNNGTESSVMGRDEGRRSVTWRRFADLLMQTPCGAFLSVVLLLFFKLFLSTFSTFTFQYLLTPVIKVMGRL